MRVSVLSRGGLAVFGGLYDPHADEAVFSFRDGETKSVLVAWPSTPTNVAAAASNITASTPTTSGLNTRLTLTNISEAGYVDISATVGGQTRTARIRAAGAPSPTDYRG